MGNPEHVSVVRKGASAIKDWRLKHPKDKIYLSSADLSGADLVNANLFGADLSGADLFGADLSGADLVNANLTGAYLFGANLFGADLSGANLLGANIVHADLSGANLSDARVGVTTFGRCNLSNSYGLETVIHEGPSSIGIDTLIESFREAGNRLTHELEVFFINAGVPKELLDELPRIVSLSRAVMYYSVFVGYGQPDLAFAEKLVKDLKARGVSCWLYSMDATVGKRVWGEITLKRREAEQMIVICSAKALIRDGVLKEIEDQKDEDPNKIVPISLDNLWKEEGFRVIRGKTDLKPFLIERNYADFSDSSKYEDSLNRLLRGLARAN